VPSGENFRVGPQEGDVGLESKPNGRGHQSATVLLVPITGAALDPAQTEVF
jgi:hypothetical protein